MKPLHYILIVIGVGVIILVSWIAVANRSLRQDVKDLKKENKELQQANKSLHEKNDSLAKEILNRNEQIQKGTVIFDSLKTTLQQLNNQNIVTIHENFTTVNALDLNGQLEFLARFIAKADSLSR
jgi:peptidoglycan hydrolase CwlO-like protein